MTPITPELVRKSADIIGIEGISEAEIDIRVTKLVEDPMLARRLTIWIPEVFGLVFISYNFRMKLPTTFTTQNAKGEQEEFPFSRERIFDVSLQVGQHMYHNGPHSTFKNAGFRSAMINVVNKALYSVEKLDGNKPSGPSLFAELDGFKLTGPALIEIPAEVYHQRSSR